MGDDGSPIEFSWVIESEDSMAVRFTMEPLSWLDGSPSPARNWMPNLESMSQFDHTNDFDLSWSQTCFDTLIYHSPLGSNESQHGSQFSVGKWKTLADTMIVI